jgi:hypothetical protein
MQSFEPMDEIITELFGEFSTWNCFEEETYTQPIEKGEILLTYWIDPYSTSSWINCRFSVSLANDPTRPLWCVQWSEDAPSGVLEVRSIFVEEPLIREWPAVVVIDHYFRKRMLEKSLIPLPILLLATNPPAGNQLN